MTMSLDVLTERARWTIFAGDARIGFVNNGGGLFGGFAIRNRYCANRLASISASTLSCDNLGGGN